MFQELFGFFQRGFRLFALDELPDLTANAGKGSYQIFIWFADLAAETFYHAEESLPEGDRERECGMKTACDRNPGAGKVGVLDIRDPSWFATVPNESRQIYCRRKREFRT